MTNVVASGKTCARTGVPFLPSPGRAVCKVQKKKTKEKKKIRSQAKEGDRAHCGWWPAPRKNPHWVSAGSRH